MRFGHLADYATVDQSGKLILGGVFDIVYAPDHDAEVIPVQFMLVASLTCSLADGLEHEVAVRLCDGEEQTIGNEIDPEQLPRASEWMVTSQGTDQLRKLGHNLARTVVRGAAPIGEAAPAFLRVAREPLITDAPTHAVPRAEL